MLSPFGIGLGAASIVFLALEGALFFYRARKFKEAQIFLTRAKQEAKEIAQLPLNNPHPLIQISAAGDIIFANAAALEIFPGIRSEGASHPALKGALKEGEREVSFKEKIYHQTVTSARVQGEDAFIIYCYDITAQKSSEQKIQRAYEAAEKSRKTAEAAKEARGEFLANMSHELRTPMNGIIGLSDILVESGLEADKQNLIEAVNNSARSLLILLNDILDFSKIEAGELSMEKIPFDIRKTVAQIESLQRPMAAQKGLDLKAEIAKNVPRFLMGDPSRLQQILNNLISNALKFTHQGSVILSAQGKEDGKGQFILNIAVTDTGIGIPKEKQAAVFEKFRQADASTARKYGGTGLGLAITKDLVKMMNGNITIQSEPGAGTTFTVIITAAIAPEQTAAAAQGSEAKNAAGLNTKARIMIVDDHPVNLLFMRKTLSKMGFTDFDEAANARRALDLFRQNPHDLIIMDCQMPDIDGFEATRQIRSMQNQDCTPIIIAATADAMKGAQEKCTAAGMNDYISKPVDRDKLSALLQKWIPGGSVKTSPLPAEQTKQIAPQIAASAPEISSSASPGFDWNKINEYTDGDPEIENQIMTVFVEALEEDIAALQRSLREDNYEEWDSWVHKIYGASANLGAQALADICDEGLSLSSDQTADIRRIHDTILGEYKNIQNVLESRRESAT